jgi:RimJ/RimL family protein N-acetyltransferase
MTTAFPHLIETARLRLRKPDPQELALYARQVREAYASRPEPLSVEQAGALAGFMIEHWEKYGFGFLTIDVVGTSIKPATIGHAGFKYLDAWPGHWAETYDGIELGYSVVPSHRGCGYVTEAASAVLAAAFEAFDLASISARCNHDNPKSATVLLRCGMTEIAPTERSRRFEMTRLD